MHSEYSSFPSEYFDIFMCVCVRVVYTYLCVVVIGKWFWLSKPFMEINYFESFDK